MITQYVPRKKIEKLGIKPVSFADVAELFRSDIDKEKLPEFYSIDPRTEEVIIYCPSRENRTNSQATENNSGCAICEGEEGIHNFARIDLPDTITSDGKIGIAYASPNKFPYLIPDGLPHISYPEKVLRGGSFVLWWNTHTDIHEMSNRDNKAILDLAAEVEEFFLHNAIEFPELVSDGDEHKHYGHFQIGKNRGKTVASSIIHGHYQFVFSEILPKRIKEDAEFEKARKETIVDYLLRTNSKELEIQDYGDVTALIPLSAMKRPLEAIILVRDTKKRNLHDLNNNERFGLAAALKDLTYALSILMPPAKEFAYNLVFHTRTGIYIEVLPATQADGAFEKIREFWACQSSPKRAVEIYKAHLKK
ncbi:hypothetical protein FJZ19_03690 [Candidatus Pacearchaeota archaeon]|nr:hypothetical protein [Candidatus Pacearchaeota archaeon]